LRVGAVDLDPQATVTTWLLGRGDWLGTANVLEGKVELRGAARSAGLRVARAHERSGAGARIITVANADSRIGK
jgi:hypothetical protein